MHSTLFISVDTETIIRILLLGFLGFLVSMLITPVYTTIAYKYRWWKKPRQTAVTGEKATMFMKLHADKHKRNIPAMAGLVFVISTCLVTLFFNLSREETWLPLAAFVGAAGVGLLDDLINLKGDGKGVAGLRSQIKLLLTTIVATIGGWYFYAKLDVTGIHIPGMADQFHVGWLIVPIFVLVVVATANAVNISDGLDGLAGGLTATAFLAYAVIALLQQRYGVAGFCLLGTALGTVAMITDTVLLLPIIGLVFVAEAGSSGLQILSKRLRHGKKIFKIAPIHHHFEASGWPETKVTMRFWIIGQVAAVLGLITFLLGRYI